MIRHATLEDLKAVAELESLCFPPQEAANESQLRERIECYGNHFWLLYEGDQLVAFADGFATDCSDLNDSMYACASDHQEHGAWQMIFGVNTHPDFRHRGYASLVMNQAIRESRESGRKGLVLTCKESLIPFYARLGFRDEGISSSVHGDTVWHQMRLSFQGMPPMRRKDREVTDPGKIESIFRAGKIVHLGLIDEDGPYVVPLHYGYECCNGVSVLYLHSARSGHKLDLVRRNPSCFVEIDIDAELISGGDDPCRYGSSFSSIMAKGWAAMIETPEEKKHALQVLMLHQTGKDFAFSDSMTEHVCVWKILLHDISAKKRPYPIGG